MKGVGGGEGRMVKKMGVIGRTRMKKRKNGPKAGGDKANRGEWKLLAIREWKKSFIRKRRVRKWGKTGADSFF